MIQLQRSLKDWRWIVKAPWYHPERSECFANGLIFHDFVPYNIWKVLERPFSKFFQKFQKFLRRQIFSKVLKNPKFNFLFKNIFFVPEYELYMFSAFIWGTKHSSSSKFSILTFFTIKMSIQNFSKF